MFSFAAFVSVCILSVWVTVYAFHVSVCLLICLVCLSVSLSSPSQRCGWWRSPPCPPCQWRPGRPRGSPGAPGSRRWICSGGGGAEVRVGRGGVVRGEYIHSHNEKYTTSFQHSTRVTDERFYLNCFILSVFISSILLPTFLFQAFLW